MLDLYKEVKASGGTRERFLERAAAEIEGLYIPKYYEADYNEDGTLKRFYPINSYAKEKIKKQVQM